MDNEKLYLKILSKILAFLAYRARTKKEIELRLTKYFSAKKNIDEVTQQEISQKIIEYLEENKLIDDEEFARLYIESKTKGKNALGRRAIASKLIAKGINREVAGDLIDATISEEDEVMAAVRLLEKKYRLGSVIQNDETQKMGKYLMSRGFSYPIVKSAIDYLFKQP